METQSKQFKIVKPGTNIVVHGFECIERQNAYLTVYPAVKGKPIDDLKVGEHTPAVYNLSGGKNDYWIVRTR